LVKGVVEALSEGTLGAAPEQRVPLNASEFMTRDAVAAAVGHAFAVAPGDLGSVETLYELCLPTEGNLVATESTAIGYGHFTLGRAVFDAVNEALREGLGDAVVSSDLVPGWLELPAHLNKDAGIVKRDWAAAIQAAEKAAGDRS
jgi:hypothetical protein